MTYNPLIRNADLRDSTGLSVIGRSTNSTGDPADIVASTDGYVLQRSGTSLIFGPPAGPGGGSGDVIGPSFATDNAIARFDATTGKLLQNSFVTITDDGYIQTGTGTTLLPAYGFVSDPNTGIWNSAADSVGITTGGVTRLTTSTTAHTSTLPLLLPISSAASPAYSFSGDADTGIYSSSADVLSFATAATNRVNLNATRLQGVAGSSFLMPHGGSTIGAPTYATVSDTGTGWHMPGSGEVHFSSSGTRKALFYGAAALFDVQIFSTSTTAAAPAFSFTGDADTGIWNSAANSVAIATNGVTRLTTSTTEHLSSIPFVAPNSGYGYAFAGATTTGMLWNGTNLSLARSGASKISIGSTTTTLSNQLLVDAGTEAAPTYSFTDNPTTGFYCGAPGNGVLGITAGAKFIGSISAVGGSGQMVLYGSTPTGSGLFGVGLGDFDRRGVFMAEQGAIKIQSEYDGYDVVLQSTSAGSIKLKTGITARLTVNSSAITAGLQIISPLGSSSVPSFSFTGDTTTGIYSSGSSRVDFTTGGSVRLGLSSSDITTWSPVLGVAGTLSTPSYSFASDTDTGIYSAAANTMGVSCGGIPRTSQAGTLTTTDDTATTIITIPTATDKSYSVALQTVMRKTSNGDVNSYFTNIRIRNIAGTVSGTVLADSHGTDLGLTAITLAISGTNALVQVTGVAATTCEWKAFADVISV